MREAHHGGRPGRHEEGYAAYSQVQVIKGNAAKHPSRRLANLPAERKIIASVGTADGEWSAGKSYRQERHLKRKNAALQTVGHTELEQQGAVNP